MDGGEKDGEVLRASNKAEEMLEILEQAAEQPAAPTAAEVARAIRDRLAVAGIEFTDSTPLIRADRER
jgi:hypothetical protein